MQETTMNPKIRKCLLVFAFAGAGNAIATADGTGVKNGSFVDDPGTTEPSWFRSDPCLQKLDPDPLLCPSALADFPWEGNRFISIGPSVVHRPASIEEGALPLTSMGDETCLVPEGERLSVLRLRVNHPTAPGPANFYGEADRTVGNVYQTDIHLPEAEGEVGENDVVLLRFDHFGLHPTGGPAARVRLIAERFRAEDGTIKDVVDWGATWEEMPFIDGFANDYRAFDVLVLGSPVHGCEDADGALLEHWMPRQLPVYCPVDETGCEGSSCPGDDEGIPLLSSLLSIDRKVDMPLAGWRTTEMRVAVQRLPDWNCSAGLEQLADYRFTIAFQLPEELTYLGPEVDGCSANADWEKSSRNYREAFRFPAYTEIDQVELGLASLDAGMFQPCDFPYDGQCNQMPTASCPPWTSGGGLVTECEFRPRAGGIPLERDPDIDPGSPGDGGVDRESERDWRKLVYSDVHPNVHTRFVASSCYQSSQRTPYQRRMGEIEFIPATFLDPASSCPADFNGDGSVDGIDVGAFLGRWNTSDPQFDLDGNGVVGSADLGLMLGGWGVCP